MAKVEVEKISDLKERVGEEIYVSDWLEIDQERINKFADATGDFQWIHVDAERAKRESGFGSTIAHGYLTVSLMAKFAIDSFKIKESRTGINYGLNRLRFITPVKVGQRIRARSKLVNYEEIEGGAQLTWNTTTEIEGVDKPACVAETLGRYYR